MDKRRGCSSPNVAQVSVAALIVNDVRVLFYVVPLLAAGTAAGGG